MQVPANLITTSWNLMQLNPTTSDKVSPLTVSCQQAKTDTCDNVYVRHMSLQDKILKVRIDPAVSADGLTVENEYSKQVGTIEMDRYKALNSCPLQLKSTINTYYDKERLSLADKTEDELDKLIEKADNLRKSVTNMNLKQTSADFLLAKNKIENSKQLNDKFTGKIDGASLLLQQEEKMNAVRKLHFNNSDDNITNEDDDYLNWSVNSEDFEIDEIDVETVEKDDNLNQTQTSPIKSRSTSIERQCQTNQLQSNTVSQSLSNGAPVADLLQKCIEESGIVEEQHPFSPELNTSSDKSSSESSCLSPMSLDSVKSNSSPNVEHTSDTNVVLEPKQSTNHIGEQAKISSSLSSQPSPFSLTSLHHPMKFLPVENIHMALSHMQKICSTPSINFTPESRRYYMPNSTPECPSKTQTFCDDSHVYPTYQNSFRASAVTPVHRNYSSNSSPSLYPVQQPESSHTIWSHPEILERGTSNRQTNQSRKRKSLCDEREPQTDLTNNNANQNIATHVSSNTDNSDKDFKLQNPIFRTHRMLDAKVTNILSHWYHAHVNYPYPNEEQVEQLSQMTGITTRQVKKWMANKRVRCFNTLSITGNQHPIKYKYTSKGRKRKPNSASAEKENNDCDSTTEDKKPTYSMLSESAKQILCTWYENHVTNPYPTEEEKKSLAESCSITVSQVKSWFANKRNRTNNTKRQVPNYFLNKHPEYSQLVHLVGQKREESRMIKRRRINEVMYIQPQFYF